MQVSFQLTAQELKNAKELYYARVHSRMVRATCWGAITLGLIAAIVVLINIYRYPRQSRAEGVAIVCALTSYGFITRRRLHEFASEPDYRDNQTAQLGPEGIDFPLLRFHLPWTKISRFVESDEMFLLASPWPFKPNGRASLQSKPVIIVLPKRSFPQSDLAAFRKIAQEQLAVWAMKASAPSLRQAV